MMMPFERSKILWCEKPFLLPTDEHTELPQFVWESILALPSSP